MDLLKVKTESECEELAIVDANDEGEVASGWLTCLEEVFSAVKSVIVLGQEASLSGFDIENGNAILAICKVGKKTARISLSSIEWPKLSTTQLLWLNAWKNFQV